MAAHGRVVAAWAQQSDPRQLRIDQAPSKIGASPFHPTLMAITDEDARVLREAAPEAEALGGLAPAQLSLIERRDWFRLLAPRCLGGAELPLPQAVRLEEAIAEADGSCGWVVTLCAGAGWFAGFLPPALAREVVATPAMCLAGSGAATGVARGFLRLATPLVLERPAGPARQFLGARLQVRAQLQSSVQQLEGARSRCLELLDAAWNRVERDGGRIDEKALRDATLAAGAHRTGDRGRRLSPVRPDRRRSAHRAQPCLARPAHGHAACAAAVAASPHVAITHPGLPLSPAGCRLSRKCRSTGVFSCPERAALLSGVAPAPTPRQTARRRSSRIRPRHA